MEKISSDNICSIYNGSEVKVRTIYGTFNGIFRSIFDRVGSSGKGSGISKVFCVKTHKGEVIQITTEHVIEFYLIENFIIFPIVLNIAI